MNLKTRAVQTAASKLMKTKSVRKTMKVIGTASLITTTSFATILLASYGKKLAEEKNS